MRPLQAEIIKALGVKPTIDPEKEIRRSIDFLKAYLKKNTFLKTYVLGISGGQDSTRAGTLTEKAMQEMRAETGDDTYQFVAVRLPCGEQADEADAMVSAVEANGAAISDFNKGNIKARMRMIAQYAIAGNMAGAVIGTDHAAEAVTGFYTKFGDGGADLTPLYRLDKRQGAALLKALGAPAHLYQKAPTADLEDNRPALPDEVALGVKYHDIDDYLEGKQVSDQAAETIERWYQKTAHKRHLPITVFDTFWK